MLRKPKELCISLIQGIIVATKINSLSLLYFVLITKYINKKSLLSKQEGHTLLHNNLWNQTNEGTLYTGTDWIRI